MKTLSFLAAAQIRDHREFIETADRATAEANETYLKRLRYREENMLNEEAREAVFNWTSDELTEALNRELVMYRDNDGVRVVEQGGRFHFFFMGEKVHDISSEPNITSPERLKAHIASVRATRVKPDLVQGDFTAVELREALKAAKDEARGAENVFDATWQITGCDEHGERCAGPSRDYGCEFSDRPSLKLINELFEANPDAVELVFYSQEYWLDTSLPMRDRWEHREPVEGGGATLTIKRASK